MQVIPAENSARKAIESDCQHLTNRIAEFIDGNFVRTMFADLIDPLQVGNEMLCIHATTLLRKANQDETHVLINGMVHLVQTHRNENDNRSHLYERVVDDIIMYTMGEGVLSPKDGIGAMILTADFCNKFGVRRKKWQYIRNMVANMEIKGIRHVFRTLLESQSQVPLRISGEQKRFLIPVEEIILDMLRLVPPIFCMTEIKRGQISLFMYPRVLEWIAKAKMDFRPLAEMCFVTGNTFLYPIIYHPQFIPTSPVWKCDMINMEIWNRITYLPHRSECLQPQKYIYYMILKQPRGKDVLMSTQKQSVINSFQSLLVQMIYETMAAVESLPPGAEVPRYEWDHLLALTTFGTTQTPVVLTDILGYLYQMLKKKTYRRARDELMWLILQIVGSYDVTLSEENVARLAALYKLLYADNVSASFASDHAPSLVRFLATACTYILRQQTKDMEPPTEHLAQQVSFINDLKDKKEVADVNMYPVIVNAFRSDTPIVRKVWIHYQNYLDGTNSDEHYLLPYGKPAGNHLKPFDIETIDSFALRAKMHLLNHLLALLNPNPQQSRIPPTRFVSPGVVETYCKTLFTVDFDYGGKNLLNSLQQNCQRVKNNEGSASIVGIIDTFYVIIEMFCYRLTNLPMNSQYRQTLCLHLIAAISHLSAEPPRIRDPRILQLFFALEQTIIRNFMWIPFSEVPILAAALLSAERSVFMVLCNPADFEIIDDIERQPDPNKFRVCPEVVRCLFITLFRTMKVIGSDLKQFDAFFQKAAEVFKWAPSQMQSFPAAFAELSMVDNSNNTAMNPASFSEIQQDFTTLKATWNTYQEYLEMGNRRENDHKDHEKSLLSVIFLAFYNNMDNLIQMLPLFYRALNNLSGNKLMLSLNWLVDYVIQLCSDNNNQEIYVQVVTTLNTMVFHRHMIPLDRLLFALVMHPSNDSKAHIGMHLIKTIAETQEAQDRINCYCQTVPKKEHNSADFTRKLGEFHKRFPEFTYDELTNVYGNHHPENKPDMHFPIYYGSLIERILPVVDCILSRALELGLTDANNSLLKVFSPVYKYHPQPVTFVYQILHCMHSHLGHTQRARHFVLHIFSHLEDCRLTEKYVNFNHQKISTLEDLLTELINRLIESSEYGLRPPPYVSQDWRFAELPPASQTLYMACIELLASPHGPELIVNAMADLLCDSDMVRARPYTSLNMVGILLTGLPDAYYSHLETLFQEEMKSGAVNQMTFDDIFFDNFEQSILLHLSSRPVTVNAMLQVYWYHGNALSMHKFFKFFRDQIYPLITTEKELWYALRAIFPLQQLLKEKDKMRLYFDDFMNIFKLIINKIQDLNKLGVKMNHGILFGNMLYHIKYVFAGDGLCAAVANALPNLPQEMADHLKAYVSPEVASKSSTCERPDMAQLAHKLSSQGTGYPEPEFMTLGF